MLGKDRDHRNSDFVGMQNSAGYSENNLAVSQKIKYTLIIQHRDSLLGIYANEMKTYVHTKTCTPMFTLAAFTTVSEWKNLHVCQNTEYPFDGTQLSNKKERTTGDNKKESPMHSAKWKKPDREDYIPHDSIYRKFLKRQNLSIKNQISGCLGQRWWDRGDG